MRVKFPTPFRGWNGAFYLWTDSIKTPGNEGRNGTEMDIIETYPAHGSSRTVVHVLHWLESGVWPNNRSTAYVTRHSPQHHNLFDGDWHTVSLLWTEAGYRFYINDNLSWATSAGGVSQVPQYIVLSSSAGGSSPAWALPSETLIDYVRVYDVKPLAE